MTTDAPAEIIEAAKQHIAEIEQRLEMNQEFLQRAQERLKKGEEEVDKQSRAVGADMALLESVKGYYSAQGLVV